ncbi:helix-turn-helix transcriptional regulator [Dactylosporangium sp. NPDC051485]|uniref:helix-turn-helix domain-containing protein n=1 Tax=Dactylosporangium sp. NPDC051485 TaxID=3154846 RepID=UPI003441FA8C
MRAFRQHPWHGVPLPQSVLGEWLQVTQAQISRIENGGTERRLDWLMFVARRLHIPADLLWFELIGEKPDPAADPTNSEPGPLAPATSAALVGEEPPVVWDDVIEARRAAGRALAAWRGRAKLTQHELAARARWARGTVANVECGQHARRAFWQACDETTGAGGALLAAADAARDIADRYEEQEQQHTGILGDRSAAAPADGGHASDAAESPDAGPDVGAAQGRDGWPAVQVVVSAGATVTIEVGGDTGAGGRPLRLVVAAGPAVPETAAGTESAADARVYSLAERRGRR